jgi:hypothetical protein
MAKRAATSASPTVPSKIKPATWGSGETMYRVHEAIYAVDQFNPSPKGNARFSPIPDSSGNVIPTLYAATTPRGALMESVFRNVPYRAGFKHIDSKRLEGRVCSTVLFQADFELLDLSKIALRGLGIPPRQLIDTSSSTLIRLSSIFPRRFEKGGYPQRGAPRRHILWPVVDMMPGLGVLCLPQRSLCRLLNRATVLSESVHQMHPFNLTPGMDPNSVPRQFLEERRFGQNS